MIDFPNYNSLSECTRIIQNTDSVLKNKHRSDLQPSILLPAADPTEATFRRMMKRIFSIDKQIKKINSPELKQMTFTNIDNAKRKPKIDSPSKKVKLS
jgi:hypothetical protein